MDSKTQRTLPNAYPPLYGYNVRNMVRYGVIRGLVLGILLGAYLLIQMLRNYMLWGDVIHSFVTYAGIGDFISSRSLPVCREELEVFLGGA